MKKYVIPMLSIIVLYCIFTSVLVFNFCNVFNRIISIENNSYFVLQTKENCFYEVTDNGYFSLETVYRVSNIVPEKSQNYIKAYRYDNKINLLSLLFPEKLECSILFNNQSIYYTMSNMEPDKRLSACAKEGLEFPKISTENINKIMIYSSDPNIKDMVIESENDIQYFLDNFKSEFEKLDKKYGGCYSCCIYYDDTEIYEEVNYEYLNEYFNMFS